METITQIFGETGGCSGLILLGLLVLVAYMARMLTKLSLRLVDFKKANYEAGLLPDRRVRQADEVLLARREEDKK